MTWIFVLQSYLTLYTTCVKELASLIRHCPHAQPALENINCPFVTESELRIQALVSFRAHFLCISIYVRRPCFAAFPSQRSLHRGASAALDEQLCGHGYAELGCRNVSEQIAAVL